jgi:hypothetical protein
MEESIMTNEQFRVFIDLVIAVIRKSQSIDEALEQLLVIRRNLDPSSDNPNENND